MDCAKTISEAIKSSLAIIEQEREIEIISRRFGLPMIRMRWHALPFKTDTPTDTQ